MLGVYIGVYPIYTGIVSGGERHFIEILKRTRAFEFEVMTTKTGVEILKGNKVETKTYIVPAPFERILCRSFGVGLALLYFLRTIKALLMALSLPHEFRVVCSSSHFIYDVLATILAARRSKAKVIVYLHHLEPSPLRRSQYHPLLPSFFLWISQSLSLLLMKRYAHRVFTFSFVKKRLVKMGFPKEGIEVMYNGVDIKKICDVERSKVEYDACFLGRLSPLKGIFDLIDIWKNVCRKLTYAKLAIIGSGQKKYIYQLRRRVNEAGLTNNIALLGALPEEEKYAVLKAGKVFVSPSYEEGWGINVSEAMACGLPTVGYNLPAYKVFGKAIIKVPVGNKETLSKEILRLLANENLRVELAKWAVEVTNKLDWDKVAEKELEVLEKIADRDMQ